MKICTQCKIEKSLEQFYLKNNKYVSACKKCISKKSKEYSLIHKEDISKNNKQYKLNNKAKISKQGKTYSRTISARFSTSKSQAKRRKINWLLTLEQFEKLISLPCFYCNNFLDKIVETSSGLDRINNSLGYNIDNCISCCKTCNRIKGHDLSMQETIAAVKAILQIRVL